MITTEGRAYEQRDVVYIKTTRPAVDHLADEVTVFWHDSRQRSLEQIRKAFALMTEIGNHQGQSAEAVYIEQRDAFGLEFMEQLNNQFFHLSTATMSEASAFINYLINLIIAHGIQTREPILALCEDIPKAVYACLLNKRCIICGRKSEIHHVDAIQMGFSRREKPQIGARVLPLAPEYHREIHNIGNDAFMAKYHVEPVRMDERLAKVYGLTEKAKRVGQYGQSA